MAKFNPRYAPKKIEYDEDEVKYFVKENYKESINQLTFNNERSIAYSMSIENKLLTQVLTSLFNEKKFYGDNSKEIYNNIKEILEINPKFIANLCIYARNEMHLRSVSHVLCACLSKSIKGKKYVKEVLDKIVHRPDDMKEILSLYLNKFNKPIPNSLKKGLANSFSKFDEYQLAKYNSKKVLTLKDIICLTHPVPKNSEQQLLWKRLLENNLKTPITWEIELSSKGNTKEVWENLIDNNHLGYMAMLRNLRNIIKSGAKLDKVLKYLTDENRVLNSKQLPFRYYSAYLTLMNENIGSSEIFEALEKALLISTNNIGKLKGKTLISADVSGSMNSNISRKSDIRCSDIAVLMLSIAKNICEDSITNVFDTMLTNYELSSSKGIMENARSINIDGGGTDITLPIRYLLDNKIFVDRIILLSDNEINADYNYSYYKKTRCQEYFDQYRKNINPNVWIHAIDLQGYGTQQFKGKNVNVLTGWSEKIFDFIHIVESGISNMRNHVESFYFK